MKNSKNLFVGIFICFLFIGTAYGFQPFPDTGQTMCYDADHQEVSCDSIQPGDPYYGQDAHYQPRIPRSYTKLGYDGAELSDDEPHVDNDGKWIMTRDNVTGLIWEIKTAYSKNDRYTWQDAQEEFVSGLNEDGFGGFSDWRLPTIQELLSITKPVELSPAINTEFFPNTTSQGNYWSSTFDFDPLGNKRAWRVYFRTGSQYPRIESESYYVRAVRGEQPPASNFVDNQDGTVTDKTTGLMWQKCTLGRNWDDTQKTCSGFARDLNWRMALSEAESLELAGYNDWRLPNINELRTLVYYKKGRPYIDTDYFPDTFTWPSSGDYWTSTTLPASDGTGRGAWLVNFNKGSDLALSKSFGGMPLDPLIPEMYAYAVRAGYSYTEGLGSLIISIEPDEAVEDGARWRRVGTGTWYESGNVEANVPTGIYELEFKEIEGWVAPDAVEIEVAEDKVVKKVVQYEPLVCDFSLAQAFDLYEDGELPDEYSIDPGQVFHAGMLRVVRAEEVLQASGDIIQGADNAQDLPALENLLDYRLEDSLDKLWAVKDKDVFAGADDYSLSDTDGTDFGTVEEEKAEFIRDAANYEEGKWVYKIESQTLPGVMMLLMEDE